MDKLFWDKVDKQGPDDCWNWLGGRMKAYGSYRKTTAHRIAWSVTNGPIPEGMHVLHTCDNPLCCNPAHLWLGTPLDNARDREAKGRHPHVNRHRNRFLK